MPISSGVLASTKRTPPTEDVLRYFVSKNGSFYYELSTMEAALKHWRAMQALKLKREAEGSGLTDDEQSSVNFAIESFLVHFRNLRDFFYPSEGVWTDYRQHDSATAWDYSPLWNYAAADWVELRPNERERINKLLSHLPYSRAGLDHDWGAMPEMHRAILRAIDGLVALLPKERHKWFNELLGK